MGRPAARAIAGLTAILTGVIVLAQGTSTFRIPRDHPAIQYSTRHASDAITTVNRRIASGEVQLSFDALPRGYLPSVLKALDIPASSQTLVFSENSLQRAHISKATPRAIYF